MALRSSLPLLKVIPRIQSSTTGVLRRFYTPGICSSIVSKRDGYTGALLSVGKLTPGGGLLNRNYHTLHRMTECTPHILDSRKLLSVIEPKRTLIKFGYRGRRKSVKAVLKRFYRLDWGIWIRPRAGRRNKLWRKGAKQRKRLRTHVFCNSSQSFMLDKMVTKFWWRKKHYVDDPYESYHIRPEYWITKRR